MKRLAQTITAMMMALTLVFCTLLQLHHHDRAGNIFITFSFIGEVELGTHHHSPDHCCHHHHHGNLPSDCGNGDNCAMYIDDSLSGSTCPDYQAEMVPQPVCLDIVLPEIITVPDDGYFTTGYTCEVMPVTVAASPAIAVEIVRGPPCA